MRKQYHLRPSRNGFYAWDVDKLVEKSKNLPIRKVPLSEISEINENYWYQGDEEPTIESITKHFKLVNEANLAYPIILDYKGRVMDGMHRVVKALLEDKKFIEAVKFEEEIKPDFEDVRPDDLEY